MKSETILAFVINTETSSSMLKTAFTNSQWPTLIYVFSSDFTNTYNGLSLFWSDIWDKLRYCTVFSHLLVICISSLMKCLLISLTISYN